MIKAQVLLGKEIGALKLKLPGQDHVLKVIPLSKVVNAIKRVMITLVSLSN
jgi:hypothetical protein